jgi:hypothetical protein
MERLLELLGIPDTHSFRIQYVEQIRLAIEQNKLHREKRWAESIVVGSRSYVTKIEESLQYRRRQFIIEEEDDGTCTIWESCAIYSKSQAGLFYPPPPQDFVKRKKQGAKSQLTAIYYPVYELID